MTISTTPPIAGDPYDLYGLEYDPKIGGWVRNEDVARKSRKASEHH